MVKRLRRCPLTAESAVRFRMGLPKKNDIPWMSFFFWYTPKRKRRGNLLPSFVNLRKQILAVGSHRPHLYFPISYIWETATSAWGDTTSLRGNDAATCLPSFVNLHKQILAVGSHRPHFCFPVSYIWETAISAWGCILLRCTERRGNLFAVVRQFAQANSCRRLPSPALILSYQLHMGNGNFRMGLRTSSLRGNDAATCLPSFVFASANFAVGSHRPHFCFPVSYIWETATSAWGDTTSLHGKNSATSFLYDKRFFRLNTI